MRVRARGTDGTIDYGSAVCVGEGRRDGEWTFLSCSHNFESGGEPELFIRGQWVTATILYRDKLAKAIQTGPGQYTRVSDGRDRSVLVVDYPDQLLFRPVSITNDVGPIALSGFPSTTDPQIILGRTQSHRDALKAELERPSQGGFSGGGVFNDRAELVGIWTSGHEGTGYGHHVSEFLPIFHKLGWVPDSWRESAEPQL
ncbi:MAG: trypsin-like peptidase domain-containing protein [Planctomycetaceae bacterium]|nr:trypsin-like peptidase domain-containing protein [Planctomycetaceae bacterium]